MTLADGGVLFLDELPEFSGSVREALREPLETGSITLMRANERTTCPARFQLVAAMSPCPCGACDEPEGVRRCSKVPAGTTLELRPGESITLEPGCYHKLTAPHGRVRLGEVSAVNDDVKDNRFHQPVGRFPDIEDDEPPYRLLVGDYASLANG